MKTILSVITLAIVTVTAAQAQTGGRYRLESNDAYGLMFDEQGAWGFGMNLSGFMFEVMFRTGDDELTGWNGKLGYSFNVLAGFGASLSLYGMGGYAAYEGPDGEESFGGIILEPGALIGIEIGNGGLAGGLGYAIDNAIDEQYLNFKIYLVF
jgi:hypothetical protein